MTLNKEQKAAIVLSIIALFVIIPQSYAAWYSHHLLPNTGIVGGKGNIFTIY